MQNVTAICHLLIFPDGTKFSHPLASQQIDAVNKVLGDLDVESIPKLMVWNKVRINYCAVYC